METATQTVKLGDIEVSVVRVGTGNPLVICGGPQLGHRYMRQLDFLADEFELIYYDARGSGMTPLGDSSELTFARAVADLEGVRAGLGLQRFSILGHSLGGHMAYLYASAHPDRVDSLVLVDVGPPFAEDQAAELGSAMTSSRTPEDDASLAEIQGSEAFRQREPKAVEDFIMNVYAPFFRDRRSIEMVDLGFTAITAANVLDYEERLVESLPQEDPPARLAMIRWPTLVVHGELDPIRSHSGASSRTRSRVLSSLCFPARATSRSSRIVTNSSERSGRSSRHPPRPDHGAFAFGLSAGALSFIATAAVGTAPAIGPSVLQPHRRPAGDSARRSGVLIAFEPIWDRAMPVSNDRSCSRSNLTAPFLHVSAVRALCSALGHDVERGSTRAQS